jgi:hypothetical protein
MKYFAKGVLLAMLAALTLTSCGGGGGSTGNTTGVYIGASVTMSPAYYGTVMVSTDDSGTTPITDATVIINGVTLAYNATYKVYQSPSVSPDGSGNFTLVVTANGATYTTTEKMFTSRPVITVPPSFTANAEHTISWTAPGGAPIGSSLSYLLEIAHQTTHAVVYSQGFITSLNASIPANTTQPSSPYTASLYGMRYGTQIANAMAGSNLAMFAIADLVNFITP